MERTRHADASLRSRMADAPDKVRVDTWLWAVRIFPTRSAATAACRGGRVRVNRAPIKPATQVKIGDRIDAFVGRERVVEVVKLIDKRVGATLAATCFVDQSPRAPLRRRNPRVAVRQPGAGRPTKRERRQIERFTGP